MSPKGLNDASDLMEPPVFSSLLRILLKSPIKYHLSFLVTHILLIIYQTISFPSEDGSPYIHERKKLTSLY